MVLACSGGRGSAKQVFVDRTDTTTTEAPDGSLPHEFGRASRVPRAANTQILQLFQDKGCAARDLAALLGAHSRSKARFAADQWDARRQFAG